MDDLEVVRAIYDAMAARDFTRIFELLADDVVVTQDERLPWGGRHVGHDGFATFGLTLTSTIDSAVTIDAVFAADDEVIQCGRTKGTVVASGAAFDIPEVHRWRVRDGKAVEAHFAIDTPAMLAVLGG
ncbi:MAG TPA: nuclear transport factor 2 family protein [Acidimicrobiales bacterium]|nr:nuclear transport factor 2 family protein [Acidimicrobiales bacterium]